MLGETLGAVNALTDSCSVEGNREFRDTGSVADVTLADDWLVVFGEVIAVVVEKLPSCEVDCAEFSRDAEGGVTAEKFLVTVTVTSGTDELSFLAPFETVDIVAGRLPELGVGVGGRVELAPFETVDIVATRLPELEVAVGGRVKLAPFETVDIVAARLPE